MAHELLARTPTNGHTPLSFPDILAIYTTALPLLHELKLDKFSDYEELWRWTCLLIWRVVVIAAQFQSIYTTDLPNIFSLYTSLSSSWPSTFRPAQRSAIHILQLRYIIAVSHPTLSVASSMPPEQDGRATLEVYFKILQKNTIYPKAGERNWKAEELGEAGMGLVMAIGKPTSSNDFGWIIDASVFGLFTLESLTNLCRPSYPFHCLYTHRAPLRYFVTSHEYSIFQILARH